MSMQSQHDRPRQVGVHGAHHHDLPTGLAVADEARLAFRLRVQRDHPLQEPRLGAANILDRLAGNRVGHEADEVAGMAGGQCDTDLAVLLHPADARPMAGARVEDDEGPLAGVDFNAGRRDDAHQPIVDRPRQRAAVDQQLMLEAEDMRRLLCHPVELRVAALAKGIQEQHRALHRVEPVVLNDAEGPQHRRNARPL
jgi:hypothetical protein